MILEVSSNLTDSVIQQQCPSDMLMKQHLQFRDLPLFLSLNFNTLVAW